jgi:hypothetical protein
MHQRSSGKQNQKKENGAIFLEGGAAGAGHIQVSESTLYSWKYIGQVSGGYSSQMENREKGRNKGKKENEKRK